MQSLEMESGTSFIDAEKKEYLKQQLNQMLHEALQDHQPLNATNIPNEKFPDPSDRATAESEMSFSHRIQERNRGLIRKIESALERIEAGTYGICEECEEEISEGRLAARPITTLCIKCKRKQEKNEKFLES